MYLSQSKAAKIAGVSRGTIANRIDDGKLTKATEGIELSELMRCFPHINEDDIEQGIRPDSNSEISNKSPATLSADARFLQKHTEWLQSLVDQQAEQLKTKDDELAENARRIDDKQRSLDELRSQHQALLMAPPPEPPPAPPEPTRTEMFWGFLSGKLA